MGKLVTIATKARFDALREASNISETSLNFILETGQLYTHNIFINGASFGTEASDYIPVKIGGVTKNLSLNGHTHSNYYDNSSDIDIGSNKIKSGTQELLKYSSDTLILGNSSIPTEFFGTLKTTKDGTKYTILDTNNFSIVNKTSTNLTLNNVALFKYGSSSFQLDYVRRYNTVETFNNLAKYTSAGTTNENNKAYGFITLSTDTGTNTYSYAQIRVSIPDNTLEFRTSSDTTWKGTLLGGTYRNITINGTTYSIVTKASSLPTIIAPTALGTSGQYLTTSDDGQSLAWRTLPTDNNTWRPIAVNGSEKRTSATSSGNLDIINGTNTTAEWTSDNKLKINATNTWNANALGVAGYVTAPTREANANMTWQTDADGNPAWRASNNHSHSYLPLSGGTMTGLIYFNQYGLETTYIGHGNDSWMHFVSPVPFYFSTDVSVNGNITQYSTGYSWIHTGNIGSQSVNYATSAGNADTVDGYHASSFFTDKGGGDWNFNFGDGFSSGAYYVHGTWTQSNAPSTYGLLLDASTGAGHLQLASSSDNAYYIRGCWWTNGGGTWDSWKTIIHSGNIGSQSVNYANTAGHSSSANSAYDLSNVHLNDQLNMTSSNWDGFAINYSSGGNGAKPIRFYDGVYNEIVRFTGSGYVGIGTSSPSYKLDVAGDIRARENLLVSTNNTTGGGIIFADDGDIVDLNDAYCSMRFSYGVRIYSANRGGSPVITLKNDGLIYSSGFYHNSYGSPDYFLTSNGGVKHWSWLDNYYLRLFRRINSSGASTNSGTIPPSLLEFKSGYPLHTDPEFASGYNDINIYDNNGSGNTYLTRETSSNCGNSSGYVIKVTSGSGASPGYGGWYFADWCTVNTDMTCIFRALIPEGVSVEWASNSIGSGGTGYWLTNNVGTGRYEWYAYHVKCGTGSESNTFFFYVTTPCTWYISFANTYRNTWANYDGLRTRYSDYANSTGNADTVDGLHASDFIRNLGGDGGSISGFYNTAASNRAYYWGFDGGGSNTYAVHWTNLYAGYASNSDTVDGEHADAFAHRGQWNNLLCAGNEFNFISNGFSGGVWFNYQDGNRQNGANVSTYYFGNGAGNALAYISSGYFSGRAEGVTINYSNDSNSTYQMLWGSGNSVYGTGGIYCNPYIDYLYSGSFYCGNWFRSTGSTGWYNESYGGGIYMVDDSYVRTYNSKAFYVSSESQHAIYTAGGFASAHSGYVLSTYYNGSWYGDTIYNHGNGNLSIDAPGGSLYISYWRGNTYFAGGSYYIDRSGNTYFANYYTTSDRNKKQNISSFSEHIRKFQLKNTGKWHYGVIAQEVPEMFRDGEEGNMTVNYNSVLSYYIGQLENKVEFLEKELNELKQKYNNYDRTFK